jgi:hypothetical protein
MAEKNEEIQEPKPLEVVATFFGFFATIEGAVKSFKIFGLSFLVPELIKNFLRSLNPSVDFWYHLLFLILTTLFILFVLNRKKQRSVPEENDDYEKYKRLIKRHRIVLGLRSFGTIYLREFILDKFFEVSLYGTFKRPSNWPTRTDFYNHIDRITYKDGTGEEFQYRKVNPTLMIRTHPQSTNSYGEESQIDLTRKQFWTLLIASNFFWRWIIIKKIKSLLFKFKSNE